MIVSIPTGAAVVGLIPGISNGKAQENIELIARNNNSGCMRRLTKLSIVSLVVLDTGTSVEDSIHIGFTASCINLHCLSHFSLILSSELAWR